METRSVQSFSTSSSISGYTKDVNQLKTLQNQELFMLRKDAEAIFKSHVILLQNHLPKPTLLGRLFKVEEINKKENLINYLTEVGRSYQLLCIIDNIFDERQIKIPSLRVCSDLPDYPNYSWSLIYREQIRACGKEIQEKVEQALDEKEKNPSQITPSQEKPLEIQQSIQNTLHMVREMMAQPYPTSTYTYISPDGKEHLYANPKTTGAELSTFAAILTKKVESETFKTTVAVNCEALGKHMSSIHFSKEKLQTTGIFGHKTHYVPISEKDRISLIDNYAVWDMLIHLLYLGDYYAIHIPTEEEMTNVYQGVYDEKFVSVFLYHRPLDPKDYQQFHGTPFNQFNNFEVRLDYLMTKDQLKEQLSEQSKISQLRVNDKLTPAEWGRITSECTKGEIRYLLPFNQLNGTNEHPSFTAYLEHQQNMKQPAYCNQYLAKLKKEAEKELEELKPSQKQGTLAGKNPTDPRIERMEEEEDKEE